MLRDSSAAQRLAGAITVGLVVAGTLAAIAPWQVAVLTGWDAAGACLVVWVWLAVRRFGPADTRSHATREDNSRTAAGLVLVTASVASLAGAGLALAKASHAHGAGKFALTIVAVAAVAVSWAVVHTTFTLRYAHEYYTPPVGGIDFKTPGADDPDYHDFAYVAFTVGMTFQVSDTDIQRREIRRTVLHQALLAYLFGAVILAVMVNVIATILQ